MAKPSQKKAKKESAFFAASLRLYSTFYPSFYLLETTLKNRIFYLLNKELGQDWFTRQLASANPIFNQETEIITHRKPKGFIVKDTGLLAESGLGFWVEFFNRSLYSATKGLPIHIFENLPKHIKRKDIYIRLNHIKEWRNLLVHARIPPITGKEDLKYLDELLQTVQYLEEILLWFGNLPAEIINSKEVRKKAEKLRMKLEKSGI